MRKFLQFATIPVAIFLLALPSTMALGGIVEDVQLKSPLMGKYFINAEVYGLLPNNCTEVRDIWYEPDSLVDFDPQLNIYLTISYRDEFCVEGAQPYKKNVFLGNLPTGILKINVFENEELAFSKEYSIPHDVSSTSPDFEEPTSIERQADISGERNQSVNRKS
jgi:hypothetical protein